MAQRSGNTSSPSFEIDRVLNPFIPRSILHHLPKPIAHFLGYRSESDTEPPVPVQWLFTFLGTVLGLCVVSATFRYAPGIAKYHPPGLIASLGASAILDFNTIRSPLAQPRNAIVGHTLSAIIGVGIAKLFLLSPTFENISWVSAAVACACASFAMSLTNTVHPPGGATAVLASTEASIIALGWMFVPFVLVGALLMLATALLVNNIARRYPMYWWTAADVGGRLPWYTRRQPSSGSSRSSDTSEALKPSDVEAQKHCQNEDVSSDTSSARTLHHTSSHISSIYPHDALFLSTSELHVPAQLQLDGDELLLLQKLQCRLRGF